MMSISQPQDHAHPAYTKPPVTERAIRIWGQIDEEAYQRGLQAWRGAVKNDFPHEIPKVQWQLALKNQGDLPVIEHGKSTITIRHRFWNSNPEQQHAQWCLQLLPDSLIVNLRRKPFSQGEDANGFADLKACFQQWLPVWQKAFRPSQITKISVEYWNRFDKFTVPQYADDKKLLVNQLLHMFAKVPVPPHCTTYVPPYQSTHVHKAILNDRHYFVNLTTSTVSAEPIALQMDTKVEGKLSKEEELMASIDDAHELILCVFDSALTDEAKEAFGATGS